MKRTNTKEKVLDIFGTVLTGLAIAMTMAAYIFATLFFSVG